MNQEPRIEVRVKDGQYRNEDSGSFNISGAIAYLKRLQRKGK